MILLLSIASMAYAQDALPMKNIDQMNNKQIAELVRSTGILRNLTSESITVNNLSLDIIPVSNLSIWGREHHNTNVSEVHLLSDGYNTWVLLVYTYVKTELNVERDVKK
jgi:hypothetical protein